MGERRNTRQRQLVLDAVRARCDHPTAEQVFADVHAQDEHVSLATVYRNLHLLAEEGAISAVDTHGKAHFDRRCDEHAHVVCLSCGRVADVPASLLAPHLEAVAESTGWQVRSCQTIFEGLCPACAAREPAAN